MNDAVTVCAHCALKAMLAGKIPETFQEHPDEHLARVHRDPIATQEERDELNRRVEERRRFASNARNN